MFEVPGEKAEGLTNEGSAREMGAGAEVDVTSAARTRLVTS